MKKRILLFTLPLTLCLSGCEIGDRIVPEMATTSESRPLEGEKSLDAEIRFSIGHLEVSAESPTTLYSVDLEYDKANFTPDSSFERSGDRGRLLLRLDGKRSMGFRTHSQTNRLRVGFTDAVPLDLRVNAGVGQARLSLSNLQVKSLDLESGVGGAKISAYEPNPILCERVRIRNGVGGMETVGLANLNFRELEFEGGVGGADLDLTGEWRQNAEVRIQVGVGGVTVRIPRDVGVEVDAEKNFLSGMHLTGFVKRDSRHYSENYDSAKVRISMRVTTGVGGFKITWV